MQSQVSVPAGRMLFLCVAALVLVAGIGCSQKAVHQPLAINHLVGGAPDPTMLADYQPWFGQ